jgi:AcrR family transcriptional regulator
MDSVHIARKGVMPGAAGAAEPRRTYHHGDLRHALLQAGIALARAGGPDAVVLREATRQAGVVPNAAYRHFASRHVLLQAVRSAALAALATAMERQLARARLGGPRAELRAIGTAYLRFARTEPGLFRTAFGVPGDPETSGNPAMAGRGGLNPYQLLGRVLDRWVEQGLLPPERRPNAGYLAWSAVHGLAMLVLEGPLQRLTRTEVRELERRLLDMVDQGL